MAICSKRQCERLTRRLCEGQADLLDLADEEQLKLARLADWSREAETLPRLEALCHLGNVRAQLLLSRYRTLAVARLFELAHDESGGETARKACVDLLNLSVVETGNASASAATASTERDDDHVSNTPDELVRAIRDMLAELGANS